MNYLNKISSSSRTLTSITLVLSLSLSLSLSVSVSLSLARAIYLSISVPINHRSWQVLYTVSSVRTELMHVSFCWLINISVSICRSPLKNLAYKFIPATTTVHRVVFSSYSYGLWDEWQVAVQPGFLYVADSWICSKHLIYYWQCN